MPGAMIGIFGKQRSGKTLFAYQVCKLLINQAKSEGNYLPCYTNLYTEESEFIYLNRLADFPLDLNPKIFLIDEIYNGCDAQDYKKLKEISIFVNTVGKQNCLLLFTSIEASMVYNRIRNQMDLAVLVKKDMQYIYYRLMFLNQNVIKDYKVPLSKELFKDVLYDTNFIPKIFDWSMVDWNKKLENYYTKNYPRICF